MKYLLAAYVICVFAGSWWIGQKPPCDVVLAAEDLHAKQLLSPPDWTSSAGQGLACRRTANKVSGRYLIAATSKGQKIESTNLSARPKLLPPKSTAVFWIAVPDGANLEFMEPGSRFYLCADTCAASLMQTEAIRCGAEVPGAKRACEVAVIVPETDIAGVQTVMGKAYRFVNRE